MIARKKEFGIGMAMMIGFIIILVIIFLPIFKGQNGLNYLDSLYNSISKGSAYYIENMKNEVDTFGSKEINVSMTYPSEAMAQQAVEVLNRNKALVNISGNQVKVNADIQDLLKGCLLDADSLYDNEGEAINNRYGIAEARQVLYIWWISLTEMEKDLKKQKAFKEAKISSEIVKKAVEPAYNYYGIEAQQISDKLGIVLFSLLFYVSYTLWYGFSIMYLFEGWGLELEDH